MKTPLADRIRPKTLDEVVGQKHLIGEGKILRNIIENDEVPNMIFYGPSGVGKTTIANIIAQKTGKTLHRLNATTASVADIKNIVSTLDSFLAMDGVLLYLDEIQHFNKKQQQSLLEFMENGKITLIASTTENPYFEVNGALLSRSIIFELKALEKDEIKELLLRAVTDKEKGLGSFDAVIEKDALEFLADISGGDARSALNAIELGVLTTERGADGKIHITMEVAEECIQKRVLRYDKTGDNHYDTISAFIKSMRGSDPDAVVYYLARMLYAGEDIKFIARRIMICAAEDVSNADPQALVVATAAAQAVERLGMPEARIVLSQAALYVACAPKSNSAIVAIDDAMDYVKTHPNYRIPAHLMDAHYKSAAKLGHGIGYQYSHDYENHYVRQQYLPDEAEFERFFHLSENGYEKKIKQHMKKIGADKEEW